MGWDDKSLLVCQGWKFLGGGLQGHQGAHRPGPLGGLGFFSLEKSVPEGPGWRLNPACIPSPSHLILVFFAKVGRGILSAEFLIVVFGPNVFTAGGRKAKDSALACELTELCTG